MCSVVDWPPIRCNRAIIHAVVSYRMLGKTIHESATPPGL